MDTYRTANRRYWDQLAQLHPATPFYKLDSFKRGEMVLDPIVRDTLGDISGKRVLHLQCHFGLDTLSIARLGAEATGLDFSPVAIETARRISAELGISAAFVEADVLNAPEDLRDFDVVFASWGALCWISDLDAWMRTAARALKRGGRLAIVEAHPAGMMLDLEAETGAPLVVRYPYDSQEAVLDETQGSYADRDAILADPRCYLFEHGLERIFSAMLEAGLTLRVFREFDRVTWPMKALVKAEGYYWRLPEGTPFVPLSFALQAERSRDIGGASPDQMKK